MEGWNFEADYSFDWADVWSAIPGSMTLRHLVTYQPVLETQNLPGTRLYLDQPAQDPHDQLPQLPGRRLGL